MATLELDRVSKVYNEGGASPVVAVRDVDLAVKDGEIVALLGSSGCGKTSMLRMVAGFESVTRGAVRLDGKPIHELPPARRGVAMAFEGYALYPPLSVRENIGFALLRDRRPRQEVESRVQEVADLLDIVGILDRYPATISAGQQQRTSLARALVRRAPVSLLDEPMSQLEPQLRALLRARIKDFLIRHRMTCVFVTHDQTEAMALADRIAVMEKGELQQYATPAELKERPSNLFVASFIGEPPMNIFAAAVRTAATGCVVEVLDAAGAPAFRFATAGRPPDGGAADGRCRLGIRPHRVTLGSGRLVGRVVSNHFLGDQTHIGLEIGGCTLIAVSEREMPVAHGDEIAFELRPDSLHLFDAETGSALAHGLAAAPLATA
jgi:multiple sugar transport system ATP-binding protein